MKNLCRMGRKLPPFAPAVVSTQTAAGRKRKTASLAPLTPRKRWVRASGGWASLPIDIICLILRQLVAIGGGGDVVDYIAFRAVCFGWRACTPTPRDPTLRDPRLRPRAWVALCDGDAVRPDDACEIPFFHTRTARCIRVRLPELRRHRIVGFTDGLVILLHKSTTAVRVLHPFTLVAVDLPPLAAVYREVIGPKKHHLLEMNAVVCSSATSANSIAVMVWFHSARVVLVAEPGSDWKVLHRGIYVRSMLQFQGRLYATFSASKEIVQLYPPRQPRLENSLVVARIPDIFGEHIFCQFFLVESGGRMLLVVQYPPGHGRKMEWSRQVGFRLYAVDLCSKGIGNLIPVSCLGDRALFLNSDRCLAVSARDLPSLSSNSIYFSLPDSPVVVHSLRTGLSEQLAEHCQIHNSVDRIRPSVRPFSIVDHLLTYCHPSHWIEGLMFHEYHHIPDSFKELRKNIQAKDSRLRIPRIMGQ